MASYRAASATSASICVCVCVCVVLCLHRGLDPTGNWNFLPFPACCKRCFSVMFADGSLDTSLKFVGMKVSSVNLSGSFIKPTGALYRKDKANLFPPRFLFRPIISSSSVVRHLFVAPSGHVMYKTDWEFVPQLFFLFLRHFVSWP